MSGSIDGWGWDPAWQAAFELFSGDGATPARVIARHRGRWILVGDDGEVPAGPTGRLRHRAGEDGLPAVGDWVACDRPDRAGAVRFDAVLPRRSAFIRRGAGSRVGAQVIAANVDVLLVTTSLNRDLNERRLERYVALGRSAGAEPVVVLTKADLVDDSGPTAERLGRRLGVATVPVSALDGAGLAGLGAWLAAGRTIVLVGSSGVGKSTLLNRLAGSDLMATREIREDDARGRHTTTHRELFRLAGGALVIDTPGLREVGLWDAEDGVEDAFGEIVELAARCRFDDCSHEHEPACAVRAAIAAGDLDDRRLRAYRRLHAELAEQPTPAERREEDRRFYRAVRIAAARARPVRRTARPDRHGPSSLARRPLDEGVHHRAVRRLVGPRVAGLAIAAGAAGCGGPAVPGGTAMPGQVGSSSLRLASTAFAAGGAIPERFTCDGRDVSPPLDWSSLPPGTVALAFVVDDPDARGFVHWVATDIPPGAGAVAEGASGTPAAGREGRNDFGRVGYGGPCPPSGTHHYRFTLYALSAPLALGGVPTARDVRNAVTSRLLGQAELIGTYTRRR